MNETMLTLAGNLTDDPQLRVLDSGIALCTFTVATTRRQYDPASGTWQDAGTMFVRCAAWRDCAENTAASLSRGMRVIAAGRLRMREYTDSAGVRRADYQLDAYEVAPSLRWASAGVTRRRRVEAREPAPGQEQPRAEAIS